MSGRVTRSQTGKTPRKSMMPDGFVETPGTRRRRPAGATSRKSGGASSDDRSRSPSPTDDDDMSASAELTAPPTTTTTTSSSSSSTTPTSRTSATPGSSNGSAHNHVNGKMHGTAKGQMNGAAKGQVDGTSSGKIIDGWLVGSDPKIDHDPHYDFGGTLGVTAMMLGFPLLMWYMWIGATYYDGHFPSEPSMTWTQFGHHLVHLAYTGAFPHAKAWRIYWGFLLFEAVLYLFAPGVNSTGKPLAHAGGRQLQYYCSGVWSFYISIAVALALHYTGLFKLYTLIDEFGPLMSVAICAGFTVAVVAYVSALARGAEHRMTGYHIYDFFMGAELNPRMFGWLDLKMFFEVRLPWYILFFISLSAAFRQIETYGYVSGEVAFLVMAHWLYANACSKGEEMIVTTWDIYYEKWGFMLIFWNSAGVPLSYCHCTIFLANHHPSEYRWSTPVLVFLYLSYLFAYWVWDTGNSQKNMFRADERGVRVDRNTFPQLPWKEVKNPAVIRTESGDSLMVDGWFKYARKINYTADFYFAFCWGLITGFKSPFPWFYPVFFALMIVHRAYRDIQRCKLKYGAAWEEYERRTPYLFIPYVI